MNNLKFMSLVLSIFVAMLSACTAAPLKQETKDKIARLEWSPISLRGFEPIEAYKYCKELNEKYYGGHNNWRLPTIDELRSIIKNCPNMELEGKCRISEENDNLSYYRDYSSIYCASCKGKIPQEHSKLPLPYGGFNVVVTSKSQVEEGFRPLFPDYYGEIYHYY